MKIETLKDLRNLVESLKNYDDNIPVIFCNNFQEFEVDDNARCIIYPTESIEIDCRLIGDIGLTGHRVMSKE